MSAGYYPTSTAFLEALAAAGVRYIFANLGSDHPGLIEALAQLNAEGRAADFPRLIVCPHETVALSANRASPGAAIYAIDIDPLKAGMSMWHIPARRVAAADTKVAVEQIARFVLDNVLLDAGEVETRRSVITVANPARRAALDSLEQPEPGVITPRYLTVSVRDVRRGTDALVLTEAITNYQVAAEHLRASRPGSLLGSGGGSLGWTGGGAVGAKLAAPERTVVCLVGDGSFLFGVPSSAQWVARRYGTPALTVIYDNRGWAAPKFSTLAVHAQGAAAAADDFHVSFEPEADLPGVAGPSAVPTASRCPIRGRFPACSRTRSPWCTAAGPRSSAHNCPAGNSRGLYCSEDTGGDRYRLEVDAIGYGQGIAVRSGSRLRVRRRR